MKFWYTARGIFTSKNGEAWEKYLEFSKLNQLVEVVSLDAMLNELLVEPNYDSAEDWDFIATDGEYFTGLFTSIDYVMAKKNVVSKFNLLMAVKEPDLKCETLQFDDYEFIGYDLLDKSYDVSALVNCGGFDNTFAAADLNKYGLINEFEKARDTNENLFQNNPAEYHAECNMLAIWRHKSIGRK